MSSRKLLPSRYWRFVDLKKATLIWAILFLGLSFVAQINYDAWRRYSPPKLVGVDYNIYIEPQPLSAPIAKAASFGATEFLADYYWLSMIQYYGGGTPNGRYRKLAELFNVVTDLSPRFVQAYQTGLIILPGEGFADEAIALGQKGQQNLPDSWEIPYYTGLVYHIYKKDFVAAAKEFEIAASKKDAPPITKYFAGIYYKEADQRQLAYQIFLTVHETTTDDYVRERSAKQLGHLEAIFFLEDAVVKFRNQYHRTPSNLSELVKTGVITEIPTSPLGTKLAIEPETGKIIETK